MMLPLLAPAVLIIPVTAVDIVAVTLGVAVILDSTVSVVVTIIGATTDGSAIVGGFVTVFF